ncbi:hypothetical protein D1872_207530 [compost metagenome]
MSPPDIRKFAISSILENTDLKSPSLPPLSSIALPEKYPFVTSPSSVKLAASAILANKNVLDTAANGIITFFASRMA